MLMQTVTNTKNTASTLQSCPACSIQSCVHRESMHYCTLETPGMKICRINGAEQASGHQGAGANVASQPPRSWCTRHTDGRSSSEDRTPHNPKPTQLRDTCAVSPADCRYLEQSRILQTESESLQDTRTRCNTGNRISAAGCSSAHPKARRRRVGSTPCCRHPNKPPAAHNTQMHCYAGNHHATNNTGQMAPGWMHRQPATRNAQSLGCQPWKLTLPPACPAGGKRTS